MLTGASLLAALAICPVTLFALYRDPDNIVHVEFIIAYPHRIAHAGL
ncbi:hypothetical protein GCM10023078_36400 [Gibbsiella greigii]